MSDDLDAKLQKPIRRIMIFGRPGSGKSTFSYYLSNTLNIPLFHLDKYFYISNWNERNYDEFIAIQKNLVSNDMWIIDGNSTKSLEIRYKSADLILYFNFPRYLCYFRILKRYFKPNKFFDDRAKDCKEQITWSLLKYMWGFENRVTKSIKFLQKKYPEGVFVEIRGSGDLKIIGERLVKLRAPSLL
jgi:adenylate kinase family enzyme